MTTVLRHLGKALFAVLLITSALACTDKRQQERKLPVQIGRLPPQALEAVTDIRINGQDITAYQMAQKGGALYITGVPFGFTKWDIISDAEAPHPTFIAADEIDKFQPMGRWRPDWYGSGALGIIGPYAIMSGYVGASFINMGQTANPIETKRYPAINQNSEETPQDQNYVYQSIAMHPRIPLAYGLREQDHIVLSDVSGSGLKTRSQVIRYGSSNVCCVMGSTVFAGKMWVAMRGMLRVYDFVGNNGALSAPMDIPGLQAIGVASSDNLLYVQHQPTFAHSSGSTRAAGIYVFDAQGNSVAFLPTTPKHFAVAPDDGHLYANLDDTSVRIYRILWTNQ